MEKKFRSKFVADFLRVSGVALACVAFVNCSDDKTREGVLISQEKTDQEKGRFKGFPKFYEEGVCNYAYQMSNCLIARGWREDAAKGFAYNDIKFERYRYSVEAFWKLCLDKYDTEEQVTQKIEAAEKAVAKEKHDRGARIVISDMSGCTKLVHNKFLVFIRRREITRFKFDVEIAGKTDVAKYDLELQAKNGEAINGLSGRLSLDGGNDFYISLPSTPLGVQECKLVAKIKGTPYPVCEFNFCIVGFNEGNYFDTEVKENITAIVNALSNANDIDDLAVNLENLKKYKGNGLEVWQIENPNRDIYAELNLRFEGEVGDIRLCWGEGKQCIDVKSNLRTVVEVLNRCNEVFGKYPIFPLDRSTVDLTGANVVDSFRILQSLTEINGRVVLAQRGEKRSLGISGDESSFVEMSSITADGLFDFCKKIKKENSFDKLFWLQDFRNSIFIYGKEQWGKRMQRERRQLCL